MKKEKDIQWKGKIENYNFHQVKDAMVPMTFERSECEDLLVSRARDEGPFKIDECEENFSFFL